MEFAVAKIFFWESVGFDTAYWRKSTNGEKAICHSKFAEKLVDLEDANILVLSIDSDELKELLDNEFTEKT